MRGRIDMATEVYCCASCGRDTTSKDRLCLRCIGHARFPDKSRRKCRNLKEAMHRSAEDNYGEESGPDSVYHEREAVDSDALYSH